LLILFLFFILELLEIFKNNEEIVALGFINDINLIIWGNIVAENYIRLNQVYNRCIIWAK